MKTSINLFYGLMTPTAGDGNGMRTFAQTLDPTFDVAIYSFVDFQSHPSNLQEFFHRLNCFDRNICIGQSHGAAAIKYIGDKITSNNSTLKIDYAAMLDCAPYIGFGQFIEWWLGGVAHCPQSLMRVDNFYQRNDLLLGGCRFIPPAPPATLSEFDVSATDQFSAHHVTMPESPWIQDRMRAIIKQLTEPLVGN